MHDGDGGPDHWDWLVLIGATIISWSFVYLIIVGVYTFVEFLVDS